MTNLPKGWEEVNFDNFFKTISAKKYQIQKKDYLQKSIYPVIDQGQKFIIAYSNQSDKLLKNSSGLIIFGDHTRIIKFIDFDFIVGADGTQILDTKSNVDIKFAYYTLLFKEIVSLGYSRHFKIIKEFNYLVPPLEEQKKIADILSTVDKKIAFVEENINATEELKKGLMQKLLTEGIGHTEFKDSELGRIPQSWEVVKFKEITKVRQGLQIPISKRKKEKCENCYEYITIQFIKNNKEVEYIENPQKTVICTENDILMTRTGNTGIVVTNVKGVFHNNFFLIDFDRNEISKEYLVYYLNSNSIQKEILLRAGATTIPDLNHGDFYSIKFISPPLEEQKQIAEILSTVDNKLENLKEKKQSFEELKKGLMQKLLTGEVRV